MSVIFIAGVGNNDVQMTRPDLLPDEMQQGHVPARTLGEWLAANIDQHIQHVELPIIGSSIRWLLEHEDVDPQELYVHLFASDQPAPPVTPQGEWLKDSRPFAEVIKRYLNRGCLQWRSRNPDNDKPRGTVQKLTLSGKRMQIHTMRGSPANYSNAFDYFTERLTRLAQRLSDDDRIYLEITGGTPAMTSMLLLCGTDAFGERAKTLYVERGMDRPCALSIGRRLLARQAAFALQTQTRLYAYAVALATLESDGDLIISDAEQRALVSALLRYADRRLAFDFERAREALDEAAQFATGEAQSKISCRQRELKNLDKAAIADLLAELVHSARIKFDMGHYADFCQRIFRFQEASFRYLAEQIGMRYADKSEQKYVDKSWVASIPGLQAFLADYKAPSGKRYRPVNLRQTLNRVSLGAIVDFFLKNDPHWAGFRTATDHLHALSKLADLRNRGLAGHGFCGIGRQDLDAAFDPDADRVFNLLEQVYEELFERSVGESPYDAFNDLLYSLIDPK